MCNCLQTIPIQQIQTLFKNKIKIYIKYLALYYFFHIEKRWGLLAEQSKVNNTKTKAQDKSRSKEKSIVKVVIGF